MATATPETGEHGRHERPDGVATPDIRRDEHGEHAAQKGGKWWTLVAVCLGTFMLLLDITIVNVALPDIQTSLHASFSDLQWVVDAYALTLAALLLTSGSLADMYGRKRLYVVGLSHFHAGLAALRLAPDPPVPRDSPGQCRASAARSCSRSRSRCLPDAFRGKDRGVAFGIWGAITGVAVAIGPLLGGALTSGLSWRWIFFVNLPIGLSRSQLAISWARVHESKAPATPVAPTGYPASSPSAGALAALIYALIESNERGVQDRPSRRRLLHRQRWCCWCGFLAGRALRGKQPMFDLKLFTLPTFSGGAGCGLRHQRARSSRCCSTSTLYIQDVLGFSPLQTGLRLLVISGGILAHLDPGGPAHLPRAGAPAHRPRPDGRRGGSAAHARAQRGERTGRI